MFFGPYGFLLFAVDGRAFVDLDVFEKSGTGAPMYAERDYCWMFTTFEWFVMCRVLVFREPTKTALFGRFMPRIFLAYGSIVKSPAFSPFLMKYTGFTIGSVLSFFLCCKDLQFDILLWRAFHSLSCSVSLCFSNLFFLILSLSTVCLSLYESGILLSIVGLMLVLVLLCRLLNKWLTCWLGLVVNYTLLFLRLFIIILYNLDLLPALSRYNGLNCAWM